MDVASPLLRHALDKARADWLAGDPAAWSRYAECLARLEDHLGDPRCRRASGPGTRPPRPGLRAPRGLA